LGGGVWAACRAAGDDIAAVTAATIANAAIRKTAKVRIDRFIFVLLG
jgi:hypothetical protein